MSEPSIRGNVVFFAATNRPDLMDPAMKRSGRFDFKFPFLAGDAHHRKEIVLALATKHSLKIESLEETAIAIGEATNGFVGSDIESGLLSAARKAEAKGQKKILKNELLELFKNRKPSVKSEDLSTMSESALSECDDLGLVPASFAEAAKKRERVLKTAKLQ
jgi:SpoVK/Ycf46/Vps4 family AAA+-type ATPase